MFGILAVIVAAMVGLFVAFNGKTDSSSSATTDPAKLQNSSSHTMGTGPVQVVEFGDYQCPACGAAYPGLKELSEKNAADVTFVFRNFPLTQIHKNANSSAQAAEAAAKQGKFWEMHDKLYETQKAWENSTNTAEIFAGYAQQLGLNVDQFKTDYADTKIADLIKADLADGNALGVNATPTVYIAGKKYTGAYSYAALKQAVDEAK